MLPPGTSESHAARRRHWLVSKQGRRRGCSFGGGAPHPSSIWRGTSVQHRSAQPRSRASVMAGWRRKRKPFAHRACPGLVCPTRHVEPTHTRVPSHPQSPTGMLHEKRTDGELGELLCRLQGAHLEGLLEFERVGPAGAGAARRAGRRGAACRLFPALLLHCSIAAAGQAGPGAAAGGAAAALQGALACALARVSSSLETLWMPWALLCLSGLASPLKACRCGIIRSPWPLLTILSRCAPSCRGAPLPLSSPHCTGEWW